MATSRRPWGLAACALLGAVVGTLLDGIHAYGDVLAYDVPGFGRWGWFVPLEFALLGVGAGLAVPWLEGASGGANRNWSALERLGELALFACLYGATTLVGDGVDAVALTVALAVLAALRLLLGDGRGDLPYVVVAAIAGPLGEMVIAALGAFHYEHPVLLGVPVWLPALWGNAGFLIRRLVKPIVMPERGATAPVAATSAKT